MNTIRALTLAAIAALLFASAAVAQDANGQTDMGSAQQHDAPSSSTDATNK